MISSKNMIKENRASINTSILYLNAFQVIKLKYTVRRLESLWKMRRLKRKALVNRISNSNRLMCLIL